jgi:outer membrane protein assembly factor BamB
LLSLICWLGGCPQAALAGQQQPDRASRKPLPAPLLPAEEAWNVPLPSAPSAQGALDEHRAYIPLQSGQVVALNRETGASEWSIDAKTSWPALVDKGSVYIATAREVVAVRATNGESMWTSSLDGDVMAVPALQGTTLVILTKPDQLRALRTSDGSEIWKSMIRALPGAVTMAADTTGVNIVAGSTVTRFSLDGGQFEWERELSGTLGSPAVAGNRVFVGSTDNYLYALDAGNGRLAWRVRAGGDVVGAGVDDRFVYVASLDNLLRALHRGSGNQAWKRDLATRTIAPPATFGGIVIVSGNDPTLSTFDATTGQPIAKFSLAADLQGVLLLDPKLAPFRVGMVAVTRDGRAIGLKSTGLMFREAPVTPLLTLPGRPLNREPIRTPASAPNPRTPGSQAPK